LGLMDQLQQADVPPTVPQVAAIAERRNSVPSAVARWHQIQTAELPALNQQLKAAGAPELK